MKLFRIGVTGAPGMGKTELAKAVAEKLRLPLVSVAVEEVLKARRIDLIQASLNKSLARELQYALFLAQIDEEDRSERFVSDRTTIDCLAHFRLYDLNGEAGRFYKERCLSRDYSLIAYVPYYGTDNYLREIDRHIFRIINEELPDEAPVVVASGGLDQKLASVLKAASFLKAGEKAGSANGVAGP